MHGLAGSGLQPCGVVVKKKRMSWFFLAAGVAWLTAAVALEDSSGQETQDTVSGRTALLVKLDGPIGPATSHFIVQGLERARDEGHALMVLQIDTPGGLESSMRDIIKEILASPIPVVSFVGPNGARAASAGTYIMYASHVAAMAPATNLGSATPVPVGGDTPGEPIRGDDPEAKDVDKSEDKPAAKPATGGSAMERKIVNDSVAYIRGLADLRGRNADWAEKAVREGANLQASAALEMNVIDLVAADIQDLLRQIDGRKVKMGATELTLATTNLTLETHEPDWRTELLSVLTNPTIAYGLLLIGIYGLMFEGYNPGAILPGVVGAICLLLALFAFQVLSVNFAGLALIALGALLVVAEAFAPSFGALGIGGLVSFVIGSIILFDKDVPGYSLAMPVIATVAFIGGSLMFMIMWLFGRSRRRPVVTGAEQILHATAVVAADFSGEGRVRLSGELWNARSSVPLTAGQRVKVVKMEGLLLWVEPENKS